MGVNIYSRHTRLDFLYKRFSLKKPKLATLQTSTGLTLALCARLASLQINRPVNDQRLVTTIVTTVYKTTTLRVIIYVVLITRSRYLLTFFFNN